MGAALAAHSTFMGIMGTTARREAGMPMCAKDGIHLWQLKPGRMARCVECYQWRLLSQEEREAHTATAWWEHR